MKKMLLFTLSLLMTAQLLQGQALNPSAAFEISSTTQGFLPPRMTTAQRNAIQSPAEGLIVYNTDEQSMEMHTDSGEWVKVTTGSVIKSVSFLPATAGLSNGAAYFNTTDNTLNIFDGVDKWYRFNQDASSAVWQSITIVHNNLTYKTTLSAGTGEIWLDRNIGATAEPTGVGSTGTEFGDFYTFAEAQSVCPTGYRLPTKAEWEDEELHFETPQQAFAMLKLTRVGYGSGSGADPTWPGTAYYWSSTTSINDSDAANTLILYSSDAIINRLKKHYGGSVRCIQN